MGEARRLARPVFVTDHNGRPLSLKKGAIPSPEVAALIRNPMAWDTEPVTVLDTGDLDALAERLQGAFVEFHERLLTYAAGRGLDISRDVDSEGFIAILEEHDKDLLAELAQTKDELAAAVARAEAAEAKTSEPQSDPQLPLAGSEAVLGGDVEPASGKTPEPADDEAGPAKPKSTRKTTGTDPSQP